MPHSTHSPLRAGRWLCLAAVLGTVVISAGGCATKQDNVTPPASPSSPELGHESAGGFPEVVSVPPGTTFDYQLGGHYSPAAGVGVVVRDRSAPALKGAYSICYLNAFQTQPGERQLWSSDLLLGGGAAPVMDPAWPQEVLLDTSTASKRAEIVTTMRPWIEECASRGFQAVELDNLDSFTRSNGALTLADNAALAADLVATAHAAGLAVAQKNTAEHSAQLRRAAGFDFAIAESCAALGECELYTATYGARVLDVEYTDALPQPLPVLCRRARGTPGTNAGADAWRAAGASTLVTQPTGASTLATHPAGAQGASATPQSTVLTTPDAVGPAMVLRDRALSTPGTPGYAFATCPPE